MYILPRYSRSIAVLCSIRIKMKKLKPLLNAVARSGLRLLPDLQISCKYEMKRFHCSSVSPQIAFNMRSNCSCCAAELLQSGVIYLTNCWM